ncbi:uncharacterized protein PgNI_01952, partial [Pyricularia grisea]|uniref:Uncharacterized protein n=1 Tax=Pyricularia grisea TaxID=148305 RepID=A0A6P8BKN5_PYRGI
RHLCNRDGSISTFLSLNLVYPQGRWSWVPPNGANLFEFNSSCAPLWRTGLQSLGTIATRSLL